MDLAAARIIMLSGMMDLTALEGDDMMPDMP